MSSAPTGWTPPRTTWTAADPVGSADANRVEGNTQAAELGNRTIDQVLAAPANVGTLRQVLSWFAGRIRAITGAANWWDTPATTLSAANAHVPATTGIHGVGTSTVESVAGAQSKVDAHAGVAAAHHPVHVRTRADHPMTVMPDGTSRYVLMAQGIGVNPAFTALVAGDIASGHFTWARLHSGIIQGVTTSFSAMAVAPGTVWAGGALVFTGGDFIYAFRGGADTAFWRYSISANTWAAMAVAPSVVGVGGALVFTGGDFIYAFQGHTTAFWRYSISANTWAAMAVAPSTVGAGGALVFTGGDFIYAFRGGGDTAFWRYSISANTWAAMAVAPSTVESGGALVFTGGDFIYAFQGHTTAFWRTSLPGWQPWMR